MDQLNEKRLFGEFQPVPTEVWEEKITADLKGADYKKKLVWKTDEGFEVRPYYRAEDLTGLEYLTALPDHDPYVRGHRIRDNKWIIRQDFSSTEHLKANEQALCALQRGVNSVGLNVSGITTHKQMSELLQGLDFSKTAVNFTTSRSYPLSLELFIYEVNHRGDGGDHIRGSINFDPISYLLLHGDYYINWTHNVEEAEYLIHTVLKRLPHFKAITVNGHYFQDAGANLVQELAFSMAAANEYLVGLTAKGFHVDAVAPHLQISFAVGPNYFMEIAKLRAARLLWTRILEQYPASLKESYQLFLHAQTARWNKTLYDPYVNMLRTTTEGMSAVLGNADSVTLDPFDKNYREPSEFSYRIARNQQLVLKEESYFDKVVDPAAGSYYIENLTHSIAHHAWKLFKETEARGGILECIKSGYIQEEVTRSRQQKEADIAQKRIILLGTNQYPNVLENMGGNQETEEEPGRTEPSTYPKLTRFRGGSGFEQIRLATEAYVAEGHKRPAVFLFTMGNLAMLRARAGFASNFFGCAGYEIIDNPGFTVIAEGVTAALDTKAEIVVICSSDEEYAEIVPEIARLIKQKNKEILMVVAGYPKDLVDAFRSAGIDDFIHVRSNLLETLSRFQRLLKIKE
ncbi:MAG TPA: methylmalonyl-CoA mutase family protein [Bacteroidales bacterium]|nr:methylmalonyl-CoA mutase family protein [Bacteroidales bacterium]